ncbi:MAG: IS1182 family transposase [Clostridiales bacterium]|nr:IS1182 family transposase [Clostridiales bacterium]
MQLVLPLATEFLIPADDSVRLLSQLLEELDYRKLYQAYSRNGRNPAVSPKNLFKVLVYGYMSDILTSRDLETACRRDINFMWLLEGQKAPDHNTIARFRSGRLTNVIEDLFNQLIEKLHQSGEVPFENIFIDGTKIEACANKYSFVWKKTTAKNEEKLKAKINKLLCSLGVSNADDKVTVEYVMEVKNALINKKTELGIEFVTGKGKHKTQLQRNIEALEEYIERQLQYNHYNRLFDGRNSFSKTDTDATFMHMKEDHMRNSQLKPGYNVQIGVEAEYIVGVDISSERSDQNTLIPFLDRMAQSYSNKFENVIADAGYESEENYVYLRDNNYASYIKPQNYEMMKSRKGKKNIGSSENMQYIKENNTYLCNQGRKLSPVGKSKRSSKSGYTSDLTIYECESCDGCPVRASCTKSAYNKRLTLSRLFIEYRSESLANIKSPRGILLRMNRSIQAEGAFGALKEDHGFRRFLLRGKKNVRIEFLLMSFGYNVNKLHNKIQDERCGAYSDAV